MVSEKIIIGEWKNEKITNIQFFLFSARQKTKSCGRMALYTLMIYLCWMDLRID